MAGYEEIYSLGIDLGTTFSAIARWDERYRRAEALNNRMGNKTTQSAIYIDPATGEVLVGQLAFRKGIIDPDNGALGVKRLMDDASQKIMLDGKEYTPIELSAKILWKLYEDQRTKFAPGVFQSRGTVVTVPYYFKAHQFANTRAAAEMADIKCEELLQEPIAASLKYAWDLVDQNPDEDIKENILVFDLGGGTFDLTLFALEKTHKKLRFEVLASDGHPRLGGMDFDECVVQLLLEKSKIDLSGLSDLEYRKARGKILEQAIIAKEELSSVEQTYVAVTYVLPDAHIETTITRVELATAIDKYVVQVEEILGFLWGKAKIEPSQVDRVILVGGSSKLLCMQKLLHNVIGEEKVWSNIDPSLCVAEGAAMYAAYLDDHSIFGREIEITTRTCHALGVETSGGRFAVVIPANRKAPAEHRKRFTNDQNDMTELNINIYQGSAPLVSGNSLIGTIKITDLPPRPKGKLEIYVVFSVGEEQSLSVRVEVEGQRKSAVLKYA